MPLELAQWFVGAFCDHILSILKMFTKVYYSIALASSTRSRAALKPNDELFQATAKFIQSCKAYA